MSPEEEEEEEEDVLMNSSSYEHTAAHTLVPSHCISTSGRVPRKKSEIGMAVPTSHTMH